MSRFTRLSLYGIALVFALVTQWTSYRLERVRWSPCSGCHVLRSEAQSRIVSQRQQGVTTHQRSLTVRPSMASMNHITPPTTLEETWQIVDDANSTEESAFVTTTTEADGSSFTVYHAVNAQELKSRVETDDGMQLKFDWSLVDRIAVIQQAQFQHFRRRRQVPTPAPQSTENPVVTLNGIKVTSFNDLPSIPLAGPLCVFVPANAHDAKHEAELLGFVESWADDSTVLFSERKEALEVARVRQRNISLHHADLAAWNSWHEQTVLAEIKLRRRGATADSIRGRGQLSIPLFHWISQLVKRDDPLVQNCKWFMKCDTDTYLRRGLLEREVLNKLDHTKPYHVGVPLKFNTRPYHHTLRTIEFEYNIGGPGYTFSRGLMASVDTAECVRSMTSDPVLLIHDDVATGFCATYYSPNSALVEIRTAISSSAGPPVTRLLTGKNKIVVEPNGYVADVIRNDSCVTRFTAAHPVEGVVMRMLAHHDRELTGVTREPLSGRCDMKIMAGADVKIGGDWTMDRELRNMFDQWRWLWIDRRRHFVSEEERPRVENALDLHKILFEKD